MSVHYIEAPQTFAPDDPSPRVFLAGGITGAADWQARVTNLLANTKVDMTVLNPRRPKGLEHTGDTARLQIEWEFRHLRGADAILFWFPKDALCPIALFELGNWCGSMKPIHVGVEPGFWREFDVREQLKLQRGLHYHIHDTLEHLVEQVARWAVKLHLRAG